MMLNFVLRNIGDIYGNTKRYEDFFKYLNYLNFSYITSSTTKSNTTNFIDLLYETQNKYRQYKLFKPNNFYFLGGESRIIELLTNSLKSHNLVTHNLYYAKKLNAVFLPMFLFQNTAKVKRDNIKYKYGFFISTEDPNSYILENIIEEMNIDKRDILLMDRHNIYSDYNTTTDNKLFYNSIESFVDIASDTSTRHIVSRTYLELIDNDIPIKCVSFDDNKLISFMGFNHIRYTIENEYEHFKIYNVIYDKKYFRTDTYTNYILKTLNTFELDLRDDVEDYAE